MKNEKNVIVVDFLEFIFIYKFREFSINIGFEVN
jgi:hypothetical protein